MTVFMGSTLYLPIFSTGCVFVSFLIKKLKILTPTLVDFWPGGLSMKWPVFPKMKGFIVMISECFCCLLTLHSLDSNFEDRLLLSQQPFHHRAKLPWRKKLKHKHSLDASSDATTLNALFSISEWLVYWQSTGYHVINCYTITRVKTY